MHFNATDCPILVVIIISDDLYLPLRLKRHCLRSLTFLRFYTRRLMGLCHSGCRIGVRCKLTRRRQQLSTPSRLEGLSLPFLPRMRCRFLRFL